MGLVYEIIWHNGIGTLWNQYAMGLADTVGLEHNGTSPQWDWYTVGLADTMGWSPLTATHTHTHKHYFQIMHLIIFS